MSAAKKVLIGGLLGATLGLVAFFGIPALIDDDDTGGPVGTVGAAEAEPDTPTAGATSDAPGAPETATEEAQDGAVPSDDPITTAKAWVDAYEYAEEADFLSLTCASPEGLAADRIDFFESGFVEADGGYEWTEDNYMIAALSDTEAKIFAGPTLQDDDGVTPWETMTLVAEDGQWKVCDSYYPSTEEATEEQQRIKNGEYDDLN